MRFVLVLILFLFYNTQSKAQFRPKQINWTADGNGYLRVMDGNLVRFDLPGNAQTVVIKKENLTPPGSDSPLDFKIFSFSSDQKRLLLFTNTERVWRYNTRGDYYVLDIATGSLHKLGKDLPAQSLMFT